MHQTLTDSYRYTTLLDATVSRLFCLHTLLTGMRSNVSPHRIKISCYLKLISKSHTKFDKYGVRLPSFGGHPISADLVSVREDVHCESTAQEIHT